jgi:hypothetical protein
MALLLVSTTPHPCRGYTGILAPVDHLLADSLLMGNDTKSRCWLLTAACLSAVQVEARVHIVSHRVL